MANLVAQWLFENNLNDNSGNGNTLTGGGSPTYDNTIYKQGSYSLNLVRASSQYAYRADADLSAGCTLKNGTATPSFAITGWIYPATIPSSQARTIFDKGTYYRFFLYTSINAQMYICNNTVFSFNPGITAATEWYWYGISFDAAFNVLKVMIWRDSTQTWIYNNSVPWSPVNLPTSTRLTIGADSSNSSCWDGKMDDVRLYDAALSYEELIAIKNFGSATPNITATQVHAQVEYTPATTNDFTNDASCFAHWKFESGALLTDSSGKSHTLTDHDSVAADTTNYKEGAASAVFAVNDYLTIADSSLTSGFPLKNGDTAKIGTWCYWLKAPNPLPGSGYYQETVAKWNWATAISLENVITNSKLRIGWGTSGGSTQTTWDVLTLTAGAWYHVAVRFIGTGTARGCYVRIWDVAAGTVTNYTKTNYTADLQSSTAPFGIGGTVSGAAYPCNVDEVIVHNRYLSDAEVDLIRQFGYAPVIGANRQEVHQVISQVEYLEDPAIRVEQVMAQVEYDPTPTAITALDLSADTSCKARWDFESGALGTDTGPVGTNTLTVNGGITAFTDLFKSGSASAYFSGVTSEYFSIADASLSAGFPLKNGDTTKVFSANFWVKPFTATTAHHLFDKAGLRLYISGAGRYYVYWPWSGGTETLDCGYNGHYVADEWQNITLIVDGVNKVCRVISFRPSANIWRFYTLTPSNELLVGTGALTIGIKNDATSPYKGLMDQFLVFDRKLNFFDIVRIMGRSYSKQRTDSNDFSGRTDLKALWKFESGAFTTDSSGNSNTLTNSSAWEATWPDNFVGTECALYHSNGGHRYLSIADASLSAGFPLKNGDTARTFTWCGLFSPAQVGGNTYYGDIIAKSTSDTDNKRFSLYLKNTGDVYSELQIKWGTGSEIVTFDTGIIVYVYRYYHFGLVVDGANRSLYLRVFDYYNNQVYTYSTTPGSALSTSNSAAFYIGGPARSGGAYLDELVVFNSLLSNSEIDAIRNGTAAPTAVTATVSETNLALTQLSCGVPIRILMDVISCALTTQDVLTIQTLIAAASEMGVALTPQTAAVILRGLGEPAATSFPLTQEDVIPQFTYVRKFPLYLDERRQETQPGRRIFPNKR